MNSPDGSAPATNVGKPEGEDTGGDGTAPEPYLLDEEDLVDVIIEIEPAEAAQLSPLPAAVSSSSSTLAPQLPAPRSAVKKTYPQSTPPSPDVQVQSTSRKGPMTRQQAERIRRAAKVRPDPTLNDAGMEET